MKFEDAYCNNQINEDCWNMEQLQAEIQEACRQSKYNKIEYLCLQMLDIDDRVDSAWYILGMLALQKGQLEKAYDYLSEFVSLTSHKQEAEIGEVVLYFLEKTVGIGNTVNDEIELELDQVFLENFCEPDWLDQASPVLKGLCPREAVQSQEGKKQVLELMREFPWFWQAANHMIFRDHY